MNPVAIILGAVCAGEAVIIGFLLYTMNRIMERVNDWREPVEPIDTEVWEGFDDDR